MSGESKNPYLKDRGATCYFVMPSLVVIPFLPFLAMGKPDRFCAGDTDEHTYIFLDVQASKDVVIRSGISIFQYFYHAPGNALAAILYSIFSQKAAAGLIKTETLPPTKGAAAQHSLCALCAYLQTQDWILLQSMFLDPSGYGWTLESNDYEPVPTLDPMTPEELLIVHKL